MSAKNASDYASTDDFDLDAKPSAGSSSITSGWGDLGSNNKGDYPINFTWSSVPQVIKFIDPELPFAGYNMHFLSTKAKGKKSYVCIENNCPLCALPSSVPGNKPEPKKAFTVANISTDPAERQLLIATPRLYKTLFQLDFSPQGPLKDKFWAVSRTGEKQSTAYHLTPVKSRDLQEDWSINPDQAATAIEAMVPFTKAVIHENSYEDLLDIAKDLS